MKRASTFLILTLIILSLSGCTSKNETDPLKVLILAGRNNHEWEKTTPMLVRIFREAGSFTVSSTNSPDTLKYKDLSNYDVIVSNWNSWPDTITRFPAQWEKDFEKFIMKGGGAVFVHAGASSFYGWENYHRIGIGRWGKYTHHGEQTTGKITGFDQANPVTQGLSDFYITDELWERPDITGGAAPLASVEAVDPADGHRIHENVIFSNTFGKGRSIYLSLGHNERSLLNSGFRTLLLRSAQWTAGRKVSTDPPADLRSTVSNRPDSLGWLQTDTTLSLSGTNGPVWQFNFNDRFLRPYFHPLRIKNSTITCLSPPDHPWHLGLWFCLKFLNGVNYWEYLDDFKSPETGFRSAGVTGISDIAIEKHDDYSADIKLKISYFPLGGNEVMTETRKIHVSPLSGDGSYYIDNENIFTASEDEVILDRTPIEGEPDGKSWGGYGGLSVRFSQDYTSAFTLAPDTAARCRKNPWVYMGFNTLTGDTAGMCIFQDLKQTTPSTSWYIINTPSVPFFYYSPAVLYDHRIRLARGESLRLRYRCWILAGRPSVENLQKKYDEFAK